MYKLWISWFRCDECSVLMVNRRGRFRMVFGLWLLLHHQHLVCVLFFLIFIRWIFGMLFCCWCGCWSFYYPFFVLGLAENGAQNYFILYFPKIAMVSEEENNRNANEQRKKSSSSSPSSSSKILNTRNQKT